MQVATIWRCLIAPVLVAKREIDSESFTQLPGMRLNHIIGAVEI